MRGIHVHVGIRSDIALGK